MTLKEHILGKKDIYILLLSWVGVGAFLPTPFAVGFASLSFLLVLRTKDLTKIFIVFIALLIFSDSRSSVFAFAETAKILVIILLSGFVLMNLSEFKHHNNRIFIFFLPFLLFSLFASTWATIPLTAFQKSMSYGLVFFTVPILYLNANARNKWFGLELVYFSFLILLTGLLTYLFFPSFATLVGRYRGLLGNPNGLGIFLTVLFAVYYPVYQAYKRTIPETNFNKYFIVVFALSLILTGSRTALIGVLLFFMFNRLRYFSNAFTFLVFISLVFSYEYLQAQLPLVVNYLGLSEYYRLDTLKEGSGRFIAWSFAWTQIQEVFFIGGGFGYTEYIFKFFQDELSRLGHQGNAHNSYLTLWLDTGLVGLLLFAIGLVRSIIAAAVQKEYVLPIVYTILFSTFFESWLSGSLNPFTSLFLISLTLLAQAKDVTIADQELNELSPP